MGLARATASPVPCSKARHGLAGQRRINYCPGSAPVGLSSTNNHGFRPFRSFTGAPSVFPRLAAGWYPMTMTMSGLGARLLSSRQAGVVEQQASGTVRMEPSTVAGCSRQWVTGRCLETRRGEQVFHVQRRVLRTTSARTQTWRKWNRNFCLEIQRCMETSFKGLLPLLLLLTLPAAMQAQSYTNNYGIWYFGATNGTITITGYTGSGGMWSYPTRPMACRLPVSGMERSMAASS